MMAARIWSARSPPAWATSARATWRNFSRPKLSSRRPSRRKANSFQAVQSVGMGNADANCPHHSSLITRHSMNDRRVVITGMGVITPVGNDLETFWSNLKNGVSGIRRIEAFDTSAFDCQIGGEVRDFDPKTVFQESEKTSGAPIALRSWPWPRRRWRSRIAASIWKK